ncbi:MAG: hypothetical protein H6668_19465 [Ardenticatenaceae bacterium]|nr:hypothetical protein [Ardenticatenaceae bacterium]
MDYGKLLKRSWDIVWGNKFMLLLGFLAALGSSGGGSGSNSNFRMDGSQFPGGGQMEAFWLQYAALIVAAVCFFFLLGIVLWVVGVTARGGLISAAARLDAGEKMTFRQAFADGWAKIGRLVGLSLLLFLPFAILIFVVALVIAGAVGFSIFTMADMAEQDPTAVIGSLGAVIFAVCGLLCLALPIGLILQGISAFAQRGIMLQEMGIMDSIRHGWQIFKSNLGEIIVLAVIFVVISLVVGFAVGIVMIPLAFLSFGPLIFQAVRGGSLGAVEIAAGIVGGLVLAVVAAAINSVVTAYQSTVFTLAYQEFLNKDSGHKMAADDAL